MLVMLLMMVLAPPPRGQTGPRTLRDLSHHVEARAREQGPAAEADLAELREWARRERERLEARARSGP